MRKIVNYPHLTLSAFEVGACKSELHRYYRHQKTSPYIRLHHRVADNTRFAKEFTPKQLLFFRNEDGYLRKST